ncbi:MAG: response regulator transcription factor [Burkholderiales bacterium]|nr:response regulator transcription factor [Burkholderiales bacterium]
MNDVRQAATVFIVDDSAPLRESLKLYLADVGNVSLVGEAGSVHAAVADITAQAPDCVVLDFQLLDGTALDVLRALRRTSPEIEFLIFTSHSSQQVRDVCLQAGASHFFDKATEIDAMLGVITAIASRKHVS